VVFLSLMLAMVVGDSIGIPVATLCRLWCATKVPCFLEGMAGISRSTFLVAVHARGPHVQFLDNLFDSQQFMSIFPVSVNGIEIELAMQIALKIHRTIVTPVSLPWPSP
jgi:hypothetical protein